MISKPLMNKMIINLLQFLSNIFEHRLDCEVIFIDGVLCNVAFHVMMSEQAQDGTSLTAYYLLIFAHFWVHP